MLRNVLLAVAIAVALPATSSCGSAEVGVAATVASPRLVWIAPGVWVLEDYDQSVFFYDGFYWWWSDGIWYRSDFYTDGWIRVAVVPRPVLHIRHPRRYVRYHARRNDRVRVIERRRRRPRREVRDHRTNRRDTPPRRDRRRRPQRRRR